MKSTRIKEVEIDLEIRIYKHLMFFQEKYQSTFVSWINEINEKASLKNIQHRKANFKSFKFFHLNPKLVI